jgi:hypothetical protein
VETEGGTASTRSSGRSGSKSKAEPETTEQETTEQETGGDVRMPVSQLIEGATAYLGHPSWTAAGALYGHDPDEMMSIDAAKAAIDVWHKTPPLESEEE